MSTTKMHLNRLVSMVAWCKGAGYTTLKVTSTMYRWNRLYCQAMMHCLKSTN